MTPTYRYDYATLREVASNQSPENWYGYDTKLRAGLNSVHVTYRASMIASVTPLGVRVYRNRMLLNGGSAKKRLNLILKEVGWALVTRNNQSFLLRRETEDVYPFTNTMMVTPSGVIAEVDSSINR